MYEQPYWINVALVCAIDIKIKTGTSVGAIDIKNKSGTSLCAIDIKIVVAVGANRYWT